MGNLPYAQELLDDLGSATERARTEWQGARAALVKLQELRAAARVDAVELQKRLTAFRRTARAILGSTHRDYALLRGQRPVGSADEPEEVLEPETEIESDDIDIPTPSNDHPLLEVNAA